MKRVLSILRQPVRLLKASSLYPTEPSFSSPKNDDVNHTPESISQGSVHAMEDSRQKLTGNTHRINSSLENLPSELRCHLLFHLDLNQLSALVHASPTFHEQYLLDRGSILSSALERTLGGVVLEAWAVYQSGQPRFLETRSGDTVIDFVKTYKGRSIRLEFEEDVAAGIAAFYLSVISLLAGRYSSWALDNFDKTTGSQTRRILSKTEETRLLRALYRFQLCCNFFGENDHPRNMSWGYDSLGIVEGFLCMFVPWETEEIACIYDFCLEMYDQVFRDIYWDVHPKNPKFDGRRPPTPDGAFDFDESVLRDSRLLGTASRGLELLAFVSTIKYHELLVSTMQKNIRISAGHFVGDPLMAHKQSERHFLQRTKRDQKQRRGEPLPFRGDGEADAEGRRPPLAWTLIWGGTYSNMYGGFLKDSLRSWGYVMWDAARIEQSGVKKMLSRPEYVFSEGTDPREDMYLGGNLVAGHN